MTNPRHALRAAVRAALLPCVAAAGWLPTGVLAQSSPAGELEEIVVTARKQTEALQSVPVAITAISASTIEDLGLRDLADISKITAGLVFDNEFSRTGNRPVIRGQANIQGSSGVSYFIDGVYISGSIAAYDLNDVERIEVIKGPQSALYGRNTYSGAINIITKSPGDQFSADAKLEVAEDDQFEVAGTLRGPLVGDVLSGGITARYYAMGGPFTNKFDNRPIGEEQSKSLSGVLQFTPTESLDIRLRAYYAELDDGQPAIFATSADENNCYFDKGQLYGGKGRYYCGVIEQHPINSDWRIQAPDATQANDDLQTSLNVRWDFSEKWALASITGYNDSEETFVTEADYGPTAFQASVLSRFPSPVAGDVVPPFRYAYVGSMIDFTFASHIDTQDWSQELRLEFDGDRFDFMLGGYYFDQQVENRDIRELPDGASAIALAHFNARLAEQRAICAANRLCDSIIPLYGPTVSVPRNVNDLDITNQAVFGLVSFDITQGLNLTAEARYQEEDIHQNVLLGSIPPPTGGYPTNPVVADATFDSFSPRVTLDWQWSDNNMLYALYAEGTKPGGFNSATAIEAGLPTYDEEDVTSYEIGSKNVFWNGQLVANLAVFFNEITGYQITQNAQNNRGNTTSAIRNAGDAEIFGGEIELSYRPAAVEGLALTLNYAYADPEFTDAVDENQGLLNDVADDGLNNCSLGKQVESLACSSTNMVFGSIEGNQIPRSARHQGYFGVEWRRPMPAALGGFDEYVLGADYSYESTKYDQVMNLAETGDTQLLAARVGLQTDDWTVTFWGRNLLNEDSVPNILRYADGERDLRRNFAASPRRPTYFGLTITAKF
jgi:outer membrane receptor protein involved in Fe transport